VKSTQDVTASLSSTAKLVDGSKEIPIKVGIVCSDTTKCASVSELNLTGQKIYDKSKATTGQYVNYELSVAAQTSNMKDSAGAVISATSPNTPEPAAGNYTGTVDLVFESAI
jgi:hypothetical protein